MTKKIFLTSTGAGVGKTYISALIINKMQESGFDCGYYKPILNNVVEMCGRLVDSDVNYIINKTELADEPENCASYWYKEPILFKNKTSEIDIDKIKYDFYQISKKHDYLLIEGQAGITFPIINNKDEKYLLKDFIWELGLSVIIISNTEINAINSIMLTAEYAKSNGIEVEGIILNNYESDNPLHWEILEQIESICRINVLATVTPNSDDIMLLEGLFKE